MDSTPRFDADSSVLDIPKIVISPADQWRLAEFIREQMAMMKRDHPEWARSIPNELRVADILAAACEKGCVEDFMEHRCGVEVRKLGLDYRRILQERGLDVEAPKDYGRLERKYEGAVARRSGLRSVAIMAALGGGAMIPTSTYLGYREAVAGQKATQDAALAKPNSTARLMLESEAAESKRMSKEFDQMATVSGIIAVLSAAIAVGSGQSRKKFEKLQGQAFEGLANRPAALAAFTPPGDTKPLLGEMLQDAAYMISDRKMQMQIAAAQGVTRG